MKSIIELAISLSFLFGGGGIALVKAHDMVRDLAISKIQKGLTPTKKLNDKLWENIK